MSSVDEILHGIYVRRGDLTPAILLDEARDPDHPLHSRFEWDDVTAGEAYRLIQAARIIRRVEVTLTNKNRGAGPIRVRAWVARQELIRPADEPNGDDVPSGSYMPVEEVASRTEYRTAWQASLERDWKRLRRKAGDAKWFLDMVAADVAADQSEAV